MANRNFPGKVQSTHAETVLVPIKLTAAADVDASGYTISEGSQFVASAAKQAEGILRVTLKDDYAAELSLSVCHDDATNVIARVDAGTVDLVTNKRFDIIFEDAGTGATATDPDSCVIYILLVAQNTASN